jgi:hypothetical protein
VGSSPIIYPEASHENGRLFLYLYFKFTDMASIIIQSDNSDNLELIAKLAKKLGIQVNDISDELSEDLALGKIMSKSKTGASVSRESVMKKLQS